MGRDIGQYYNLLRDGKYDEAELLRQDLVPDKLIKFYWLDDDDDKNIKKFNTLERDEIWFSSKDALNDPYEFSGLILDVEKLNEMGFEEEDIESFQEVLNFDDYGITCLSSNSIDFLPMWAYYTNNHKGFCVEYSVINKDCVHQVSYEHEKIKVVRLILDVVRGGLDCLHNHRKPDSKLMTLMKFIIYNMFMKHESWSHEKEFRIVYQLNGKNGVNVPVGHLGLKTNRIICGINCSDKNCEKLNEISKNLGLGGVYKSKLKDGEYSLALER